MTSPLFEFLSERIAARGPMPFAAYMAHVLYHPRHGYYTAGRQRSGWRGHFLTSPEIDPAFGELWAKGFEQVWESCGQPSAFTVVEVGPGEGGLARGVLGAARGEFGKAIEYRLVERVPAIEQRQRELLHDFESVAWSRSITECPTTEAGVVFANEVVDNLPVHLVEARDGRVLEVCVDVDGDQLVFVALPPSSPELELFLGRLGVTLPDGHRMEIPLAAQSFVSRAGTIVNRGAIVIVDYGATATDLAARPGGTLLAYSASGVDDAVLDEPGSKDVTAHANWTALARDLAAAGMNVVGPIEQAEVLRSLGVDVLHEALRAEHDAALAEGRGAAAVRALSRRQALGALTDPGGLGGLAVLAGIKGIAHPTFLGG